MIPIIQKEIVDKKKWIGEREFLDMVAISQSASGPIAVNISAFVGKKIKEITGLIVATLGSVLPSFIIIILVASIFLGIENNPIVQRVFQGIRLAVVTLIVVPVISMSKTANVNRKNFIIPLLSAVFVAVYKITPIYIILGAAAFMLKDDVIVNVQSILIFVSAFILSFKFKVDPIILAVLSGVAGFIIFR